MYEQFGAVVHQDNKVEFKLFFPDNSKDPTEYVRGGLPYIKEIRVRGDFQAQTGGQNWELATAPVMTKTAHPKGWLYMCKVDQALAEGFYQYKYFVTFENETTRWCGDPCTKYGGADEHENACFAVGGHSTAVNPITKRLPPKDLVLYELMIDDFTSEFRANRAPIDAVKDRLDYLQELGVNGIEFMPWTSWPGGGFSWGYDPVQFFAVEYRYIHDATEPADKLFRLQQLINELHARNMHVIMDGVFNHVRAGIDPNHGFPYLWLYMDPADSPYIGAFARGGFFEEFDYNNGCVEEFIRDVCTYWLEAFQIDGIRFDFTLGFFQEGNRNVGIAKLISDVKTRLAPNGGNNVMLTLEHLTDNRFDAIDDTNQICADGCWLDPFMFKSFEYARSGNIDGEILRILNSNLDYAQGKAPVTYIENHDHSTIVREAGGRGRWFKTQAPAISLLTSPGIVLLHNGQEFGEDNFLPSDGPDRVQPRPLNWNNHSQDFAGKRLYEIYQRLIRIRKEHPSLRSANFFPFPFNHPDGYVCFPEKDVVVYHRYGAVPDGQLERFIIVINYSDFDQFLDVPFSVNGLWDDLLNDQSAIVENFRLSNQRIDSNWGRIYFKKE
jgi:1,4-alpha-glucan branching enzyme